jgi:hypothetical protein
MPVAPKDVRESVDTDVLMADQIGAQYNLDPCTGEQIGHDVDPNLMTVVTACVWNSQYVTMIKRGAKGSDPYAVSLDSFEWAVKLVPDGKGMYYETRSEMLAREWDQMMQWKAVGYQGLD